MTTTLLDAWHSCDNSYSMMELLDLLGYFNDPKSRLLLCRIIRETPLVGGGATWDLLVDERSRAAVEAAEAFARGDLPLEDLQEARSNGYAAASCFQPGTRQRDAAQAASFATELDIAFASLPVVAYLHSALRHYERDPANEWQINIAREMYRQQKPNRTQSNHEATTERPGELAGLGSARRDDGGRGQRGNRIP